MTLPIHYKSGVANRQGIGPGRPWMVPCEAPTGRSRAGFHVRGVETARR